MSDADEITHRLAEVADALSALPEGPSAERFRLLTERDELRALAATLRFSADAARSTEELEAERTSLVRQRAAMVRSRGGYVMGDGADSAGRIGAALTAMHGRTGRDADIEVLTVRIERITDELKARKDSPPDEGVAFPLGEQQPAT